MKVITTDKSTISKNQLFLIAYKTKKGGTKHCLYVVLNYSILVCYADRTLKNEINDYDYISKAKCITNSFDLRDYGFTRQQTIELLESI